MAFVISVWRSVDGAGFSLPDPTAAALPSFDISPSLNLFCEVRESFVYWRGFFLWVTNPEVFFNVLPPKFAF